MSALRTGPSPEVGTNGVEQTLRMTGRAGSDYRGGGQEAGSEQPSFGIEPKFLWEGKTGERPRRAWASAKPLD